MPKRTSIKKRPADPNLLARQIVEEAIGEPLQSVNFTGKKKAKNPENALDQATISAVMKALGSKGGKIGGKHRMENLTPKQKTDLALKGAKARWAKEKAKKSESHG